jgi:hypothetical protein
MKVKTSLRLWTGSALLAAAIALSGCASHHAPLPLSGEYGDLSAPDLKRALVIDTKSGSEFEIRKLQEEDDTLFAVMLDYSFRKFPKDSVATVRNVPRDSLAGSKEAWVGRKEKDRGEERGRGRPDFFAAFGALFALGLLLAVIILNN